MLVRIFEAADMFPRLQADHAAQTPGQKQRQGDFAQIRDDEGEDAPSEDSHDTYRAGGSGVDHHEPERAESVAGNQTEHHTQGHGPELFAEGFCYPPHDQRGKDEADDIAAALSEQSSGASAKAGKDRTPMAPRKM